jgi:HEAT repeat protein
VPDGEELDAIVLAVESEPPPYAAVVPPPLPAAQGPPPLPPRKGQPPPPGKKPPARPRSNAAGGWAVLATLGTLLVVLLAACGGAVWYVHFQVTSAVNNLNDTAQKLATPPPLKKPEEKKKAPAGEFKAKEPANLDLALVQLEAETAAERRAAATWLARQAPAAAKRGDVMVRLEPLLEDENPGVRHAAGLAVARWADQDQLPALRRLLDSEHGPVRAQALEELVKFYHHPNAEVRERTRQILAAGKTKQSAVVAQSILDLKSADNAQRASAWLTQEGPKLEPDLLECLRDPRVEVRLGACRLLRVVGSKAALPALDAVAAEDPDNGVRTAALEAVGAIGKRQ